SCPRSKLRRGAASVRRSPALLRLSRLATRRTPSGLLVIRLPGLRPVGRRLRTEPLSGLRTVSRHRLLGCETRCGLPWPVRGCGVLRTETLAGLLLGDPLLRVEPGRWRAVTLRLLPDRRRGLCFRLAEQHDRPDRPADRHRRTQAHQQPAGGDVVLPLFLHGAGRGDPTPLGLLA